MVLHGSLQGDTSGLTHDTRTRVHTVVQHAKKNPSVHGQRSCAGTWIDLTNPRM